MKQNKDAFEKSRKFNPIIFYIAALIAALAGIVLLVNNIIIFKSTIEQYVTQGFPASAVMKSLIPAQLIPGICEPIAVYGGIALLLLGVGIVIKKISKNEDIHSDDNIEVDKNNEIIEDNIEEQNDIDLEKTEILETADSTEEKE